MFETISWSNATAPAQNLKCYLNSFFTGKIKNVGVPTFFNQTLWHSACASQIRFHRADHTPPTVVFAGSGVPIGPMGTEGIFGAITGCKRRYSASDTAPMPQSVTATPAQKPTQGNVVITRIAITPTAMRATSGHSSVVLPMIHCPTIAPTTTSEQISTKNHRKNVEMPTSSPTTVIHATNAAINTPGNTKTPRPNDAPRFSAACTVSTVNFGIRLISTSPSRTYAPVQITRHT